ncbi:hypothetical protein [Klebsiella variicola]
MYARTQVKTIQLVSMTPP